MTPIFALQEIAAYTGISVQKIQAIKSLPKHTGEVVNNPEARRRLLRS
jgi:hypothetical protein